MCEEVLPAGRGWLGLATRPVQAITAIAGLPSDAWEGELDGDGGGRVRLISHGDIGFVTVRFTAGLAPDWPSLPEGLRQGVMRLAAHQHREREGSGASPLPPAAVAAHPAMNLADADGRQLAVGANRALLGGELVQFARAAPLGSGRWRLTELLRGRGGTERALADHVAGEAFVLLDGPLVALDPAQVGAAPAAQIAAAGLADDEPVLSAITLRGITQRPLSPVRPRVLATGDGLDLSWTRRAHGAWSWVDAVDAPLHEQAERYLVTLGDPAAPLAAWDVAEPRLVLSAATLAGLPPGALTVRQQGSYALSEPLLLHTLA
jgi:hypothetical protein